MACCRPAEQLVVIGREGVAGGVRDGGGSTRIFPASSATNRRPSGRNFIAVGRLNPVARISFWKKVVLATETVTVAELVRFPAASRARATRVCDPLVTPRVSHVSAY